MTKYNELVDHLVSNMKGKRTPQDVTNSSTDWEDFWYNSDIIHPSESNTMRPPFVPRKYQTMKHHLIHQHTVIIRSH